MGAQGDREERLRRARRLVPRPHARGALGHRAAREARAVRAARPGVRFATEATLADAVDDDTAAILLEPVQGEGGVRPLDAGTLARARELADAHGAMLVLDEVQTGVGRTGAFFAWEHEGVRPDAVTLAKGLANGLPIGALLVSDEAPTGFAPGDHASTFGGNPVACAAACAVVAAVDDDLLAHVRDARSGSARRCPASAGWACSSPSSSAGPAGRWSRPHSRAACSWARRARRR